MKVALITDTHAGVRSDSDIFADYQQMFYDQIFFPELNKRGIKTIFHGGDIFDRRTYTNHKSLHRARIMFFDKLIENNIHMHLITGNHDVYYKSSNKVNTPDLFLKDYMTNITLYDMNSTTVNNYGNPVHFIPWINNENYKEVTAFIDSAKPGIIIGHFEIAGFAMHKGNINEHGISASMFRNHKLVISGHFHTQSKAGNIHYIGNPFEFTWNDYNDERGFWILDTDTLEMEFIENPYKMFYMFEYDDDKPASIKSPTSDIKNKYVKVIVESKRNDPYAFDLYMEKIYKESPFDVQIIDMTDLATSDMTDEEIVNATKSTSNMIKTYIEALENVDDKTKESVDKILSVIYAEAMGDEK